MEHLLLKAVTAITDEGTFEAVISTEGIDREKDIVSAAGMVDALRKWNRPIPLAWNHSTKAEDIFGSLDPASVKEVNGEVVAGGRVDLESIVGKEAWRSFKNRSIGFSFGYLVIAGTKRTGGGRHITALDVFEVTATPTPMNNETRVLNTKAVKQLASATRDLLDGAGRERFGGAQDTYVYVDDFDPDSDWVVYCITSPTDDTRYVKTTYTIGADGEVVLGGEAIDVIRTTTYQPKAANAPEWWGNTDLHELQEAKARLAVLEAPKSKADETDKEPKARSVDPLRKRSEELALEVASGGMSLRTPPQKATAPEPELIPLEELKRRSRDLMLQVLSGQTE